MPSRCAVLVSAIAAIVWPAFAAYATDFAPRLLPNVLDSQPQPAQPTLNLSRSASGLRPEGRAAGLRLDVEAALPPTRLDEARYDYSVYTPIPSPSTNDARHETANSAAASASLPTNLWTGYGGQGAGASKLKLPPPATATKSGWAMSGRVGPLRWLSPLDGEGETRMRFGGRVQGQPRMPGLGLFNVGVHYNFE